MATQLQSEVREYESKLSQAQQLEVEARDQLKALSQEHSGAMTILEDEAVAQKAKHKKLKGTLKSTIANAKEKVSELERKLEEQRKISDSVQTESAKLNADNESLRSELSEAQQAVQVARAAAERSRDIAAALREETAKHDDAIQKLEADLRVSRSEVNALRQKETQRAQAAARRSPSPSPSHAAQQQLQELQQKVSSCDETISRLEEALQAEKASSKKVHAACDALEAKNTQLSDEVCCMVDTICL